MSGRLFPSPFHRVSLFSLSLLLPSTITTNGNPLCRPTDCGEIHGIHYPFWVVHDPPATIPFSSCCGYQDLKITCKGDTPMLSLSGHDYKVTSIEYETNTINLTDSDVLGPHGFPWSFHNLTLGPDSLLNYTTEDTTLTFCFNCKDGPPDIWIPCPEDRGSICAEVVEVPVLNAVLQEMLSVGHKLKAVLDDVLQNGFQLQWRHESFHYCAACEKSGGYCGYSITSGSSWPFICIPGDDQHESGKHNPRTKEIKLGVIAASASVLFVCLLSFLYCQGCKKSQGSIIFWKKRSSNVQKVEAFLEKYGSLAPRRYRYSDVKKITKSFKYKLGQGGYGTVFKGNFLDGRPVAVKILNDAKGNGEEFVNEVASIGKTSHVNVVKLLGFCSERSKRALIYDFMPNGSLEKFIYIDRTRSETPLGWEKLYEIAVGIAHGLEYLHRGCNARIVHFDIKPHNILLDQDFCPKISDFGLAKLCLTKESIVSMTGARGTVGYIAPEVFLRNFGTVSCKSDVYSFGMMLLEMAGGRRNIDASVENASEFYFPHWIYDHLEHDVDLEACGITSETAEIARKMILVGLWCIQMIPENRPSMNKVVDMLEGSIRDLQMPPKP